MRKVLINWPQIWGVCHASPKRRLSEKTKHMQRKLKVASGKHITIATIAAQLKRSPRECRAALRTLHIPKPMHGWAWAPSEAASIKSRLAKKFSGKQKLKNSEGASRPDPEQPNPHPSKNANISASAENIALDAPGCRLDAA